MTSSGPCFIKHELKDWDVSHHFKKTVIKNISNVEQRYTFSK